MKEENIVDEPSEKKEIMFVRPIDLNISFADYFKLKFEAIQKGVLTSEYLKMVLSDEQYLLTLDRDTLELFRKLSSFIDKIDYYIIWGGDGFWRIRRKNR